MQDTNRVVAVQLLVDVAAGQNLPVGRDCCYIEYLYRRLCFAEVGWELTGQWSSSQHEADCYSPPHLLSHCPGEHLPVSLFLVRFLSEKFS